MFRSLLRFSIRDVLWLTVVVGLGLGWWIDHRAIKVQYARRGEYVVKLKTALEWKTGEAERYFEVIHTPQTRYIISPIIYKKGTLPPELANESP